MMPTLRRCAAAILGLVLLAAALLTAAPVARADPEAEPPARYRTSVWTPMSLERPTYPGTVTTSVHVSIFTDRWGDGSGLSADLWLLPRQGDPVHVARVTTNTEGRAAWTGPLPFSVDNQGLIWSHAGGEAWRDGVTEAAQSTSPFLPIDRAVKATGSAPRAAGYRQTVTLTAQLRWSDSRGGRITDGGPAAGARWALWSRDAGDSTWRIVARGTADSAGRASATRTLTRTQDWAWTGGGGDAYGKVTDPPEGAVQRVSVERATRVSFTLASSTAVWPHVDSKGDWVNSHSVPATATVRWSDDGSVASGVDAQFCLRRLGTTTWRCNAFQPTSRTGTISTSLHTPVHAEVQVRVRRTIAGPTALPATSSGRTLRVRSHVTLDRPSVSKASRTVTFTGRAGITKGAHVQILDGSRRIATVRTGADGHFRLKVKAAAGKHTFAAKVVPTSGYDGAKSVSRRVTVHRD